MQLNSPVSWVESQGFSHQITQLDCSAFGPSVRLSAKCDHRLYWFIALVIVYTNVYTSVMQPLSEKHPGNLSAKQDVTFCCELNMALAEKESIDLCIIVYMSFDVTCEKLCFYIDVESKCRPIWWYMIELVKLSWVVRCVGALSQ